LQSSACWRQTVSTLPDDQLRHALHAASLGQLDNTGARSGAADPERRGTNGDVSILTLRLWVGSFLTVHVEVAGTSACSALAGCSIGLISFDPVTKYPSDRPDSFGSMPKPKLDRLDRPCSACLADSCYAQHFVLQPTFRFTLSLAVAFIVVW